MNYLISEEALNDLESIWVYTNEVWSEAQADRYLNFIFDEIELISKDPAQGKEYSHVREGYYQISVKSHFIFYRLSKSEQEIEIVRILHQRMDIENRL